MAWVLMVVALATAQGLSAGGGGVSATRAQATNAPVELPRTAEEIEAAMGRVEGRLAEVGTLAASSAPEATADEIIDRQRLFQQWTAALHAQARSLRRLKEIRRLNQDRAAEARTWRGFSESPPYPLALVEGVRDAIALQRLELESEQTMLAISEGGVRRGVAQVEEGRRQARLARDQAELTGTPDARQRWLLRLAELHVQSSEALIESAELTRLVALESLAGFRSHLEFLERQLAAARSQARFTRADLDVVLARLNDRREALRTELAEVIDRSAGLRRALSTAGEELRLAGGAGAGTAPDRIRDLRAAVEVAQARLETSEIKADLLRSFLVLVDYGEGIWEDRFWATGDRSLAELRSRRRMHEARLAEVLPWKRLAEAKLSAASSQAMGEFIRVASTNLTSAEREGAGQIRESLEERGLLYRRALSAIVLLENLGERLMADLTEREAGMSLGGRLRFVVDGVTSVIRRIWNTELYIAEDAVIADGRKVTVPRIVTIGKVAIALGIFLGGLVIARWGHHVVRDAASRRFGGGERTAWLVARCTAALIVVLALFVAMTSVRIPWTVFAFLGGALAIGVGFGAQALINNFISGVILQFERSIRRGDIVEVGGQQGKVIDVGFRNSLIKRGDGVDVLVPNSRFLETEVVNWTLTDDLVRYKLIVGVAYGSSPARVTEALQLAAAEHPLVVRSPAPKVLFEDFGESALVFTLEFWMRVRTPVDGGSVRSDLRLRIHTLLAEAGIVLAYPQRDLHLDSARPLEVRLVDPFAPGFRGGPSAASPGQGLPAS